MQDSKNDDDHWEPLVLTPSSSSCVASSSAAVWGVVVQEEENHGKDASAGISTTTRSTHSSGGGQLRQRRKRVTPFLQSTSTPTTRPAATGSGTTHPAPRNANQRTTAPPVVVQLLHPSRLLPLGLYLCREIWNDLDGFLRGAVAFGTMGAVFQLMHSIFYYILYPEWALYTTIFSLGVAVPLYYMIMNGRRHELLDNPQFQMRLWRSGVALLWFVLPAVWELQTLHFLIPLVGGSTVLPVLCFYAVIFVGLAWAAHGRAPAQQQPPGPTLENASFTERISIFFQQTLTLHTCSQFLLYILYGTALGVVLLSGAEQRRHIPGLAGRFGMATAWLLYYQSSTAVDATSRAVRTALRWTVRDALRDMGTTVPLEELLSWTMLRWLVDYWSTTSTNNGTTRRRTRRTAARPDMEWSELWSMLQVTTNQMSTEVEELHRQEEQSPFMENPVATNAPPPSTTNTESCTPLQPLSSSSVDNVTTAHVCSNTTNSTSSSMPSQQPQQQSPNDNPIHGLQVMLASINLDERAKPAVLAYKQAVQSLPPSQRTATMLALTRRCPAILLLWFYLVCGWVGLYPTTWKILSVLLPFSILDAWKVYLWIEACKMAPPITADVVVDTAAHGWIFGSNVESMTILLLDDTYCATAPTSNTDRLPTLLLVWQNVHASVAALEVGLTAARCVQTSVVAVDFAANVMSLVHLGLEISQHGWFHGVTTVARELLHLQATGTDPLTLSHGMTALTGTTGRASYTSAAVSAWRNSQTLHRNVSTLAEEGNDQWGRVMGSVLALVPLWMGHGWLWGGHHQEAMIQEESDSTATNRSTTLEIIELDDDADGEGSSDVSLLPETQRIARGPSEDSTSALSAVANQSSAVVSQVACSASDCHGESTLGQLAEHAVVHHEPEQDADSIFQSQQETPPRSEPPAHSATTVNHMQVPNETLVDNSVASSAVAATASSSSSKIEQPVDKNVGIEIAAKFDNDASVLMDLLSYCDEHDIIDQEEKNRILENLAAMSEAKSTSTALAWTFGTKLTLERLISQHKTSICGSAHGFESFMLPCEDTDLPRADHAFGAMDDADFESLKFDGAISVSSDEESPQIHPPPANISASKENRRLMVGDDDCDFEPLDDTLGGDTGDGHCTEPINPDQSKLVPVGDDDCDFEPLSDTLGGDNADGSRIEPMIFGQNRRAPDICTTSTSVAVEGPMLEERDANVGENDDGLWLKLGASLALVGAVVGGVALAAGQNSQGEDPNKRKGSSTRREDQDNK